MKRWFFFLCSSIFLRSRLRHVSEMGEIGEGSAQDQAIYEDVYIFAKSLHEMKLFRIQITVITQSFLVS
ncbi:MAG: hypothetical protein FDW93_07170 [Bergeyella sp.]|nr:hypothetical protein [Bergeyella sp.]